jgi:hypothetical protein
MFDFNRKRFVRSSVMSLALIAVLSSTKRWHNSGENRTVAGTKMPLGIFNDPKEGSMVQLGLAGVDAIAAMYFFRAAKHSTLIDTHLQREYNDAVEKYDKAILAKNKDLTKIIQLRETEVKRLNELRSATNGKAVSATLGDLKRAESALAYAKEVHAMSPEARKMIIRVGEKAWKDVTEEGVKHMRAKALRNQLKWGKVKFGLGVFFTLDAVGRFVVWNKLDADPGLAPAARVGRHYLYDRWFSGESEIPQTSLTETTNEKVDTEDEGSVSGDYFDQHEANKGLKEPRTSESSRESSLVEEELKRLPGHLDLGDEELAPPRFDESN